LAEESDGALAKGGVTGNCIDDVVRLSGRDETVDDRGVELFERDEALVEVVAA
jgi:hypothetical protein